MKHIKLIGSQHPLYEQTHQFANKIYNAQLQTETNTPSEWFIAAYDGDKVAGCIGLNTSVSSDLFLSDIRYRREVKKHGSSCVVAEQNIFAVQNFPAGVPVLIAALAAYADKIGIEKIVYAGVRVSCRTIDKLGFHVTELGSTNSPYCGAARNQKYQYWFETHAPISCILDTKNASAILQKVAHQYRNKARLEHVFMEEKMYTALTGV